MRITVSALIGACALLFAPFAFADGPAQPEPDMAAAPVRAAPTPPAAEPAAQPAGQSGQISLMNGALTLNLPDGYVFYPAEAAYAFLQRNNAAAPNGTVLGLVAPAATQINDAGAWGTIVSYDELGYVRTDTVGALSEPTFEADVREARTAQNRPFEGFSVNPGFDAATNNLTWAERAAAPGAGGRDLRHEQRQLARRGVAGLTTIGSADQLGDITAAAPQIAGFVSFAEGSRYADFNAATDQVSRYSAPGLITGVPATEPNLVAETAATDGADTQASGLFGGGGLQGLFPWIAGGVVVLAGAGYLLFRRRGGRADDNLDPEDA